jgi:2-desacetyl-2-hydroxyethyl bacteriochlorophyllide A dehydrogenase
MVETYPMAFVSAPGKIEFQEKQLAPLSPKDVLINVKACSICGSDLHIFGGRHPSAPLPMAIGHEVSGQVLRIGAGVSRVRVGDRVVVEPVITCGGCCFCRKGEYHLCSQISFQYRKGQGGFAPYFVAEEDWVHPLPQGVSYEEGALIEPLSVALHAAQKAHLQPGHTVAIFGAGAVGLLILLLTRLSGVVEVFVADVHEFRLKKAEALGASGVIHNRKEDAVEKIMDCTSRLGVDRAFEVVGLESTLVQSLQVLKKGGSAVVVGIFEEPQARIPANLFIQREISLLGSQGYCRDFQTAIKLVDKGLVNLKEVMTHVLPLSSLREAFELLRNPGGQAVKVVITMEGKEGEP